MRFSTLASLGGLAAVATADYGVPAPAPSVCSDKTVTQTVTITAAPTPTVIKQDDNGYGNSYSGHKSHKSHKSHTTSMQYDDGYVSTSVEYGTYTTSTLCPSAGTYANSQMSSNIQCGSPGWTTYTLPVTTVIAYPSGSYGDDKKDCIVAIYQDITVINVVVVDINVTIINGQTSTVTVTKTDEPAYTPPANPTYGAPIIQETHYVDVGGANLTFNPNQIRAKIGDVIKFKFLRLNHTLTQSEFNSPCTPNKLFDTGFNQFNNGTGMAKTIKLDVTTEAPQWFYCKQPQGNHCGKGMVFAINPDNMDQFIKNAIAQNGNTSLTATPIGTGYYPTGTGASYPTGTAKAMPTVIVGGGTSLTFTPPFLQNIKRGDKIFFDFLAKNHTLTESTFESPCSKRNGSDVVDTDFMNFNGADVPGAKPFTLEVKSDGERYFYCRQGGGTANSHCAAGMVFGINIDKNKFDKFQSAAKGTASTITTSSTVPTSSTAMTSSTVMTSSTAPTPSNVYKAPTPYKIKGRMVMP